MILRPPSNTPLRGSTPVRPGLPGQPGHMRSLGHPGANFAIRGKYTLHTWLFEELAVVVEVDQWLE